MYAINTMQVPTKRGYKLRCSHWRAENGMQQPCVVYLHSTAGCRLEAMSLLTSLLTAGFSLFAFDFGASRTHDCSVTFLLMGFWLSFFRRSGSVYGRVHHLWIQRDW